MTTNLSVRQATIDDLDEVTDLFNQYRIFYNQGSDPEGARSFLFDRFEHRESIIFIATESENDRAIGFTQLYPSFSSISMKRSWILNDLFVHEEYRRSGIAKLLLEKAKAYAIQTGAKGLGLSTAITNEIAQKLYEQQGFKKDIEFYHYYLSI